jgi:XTP/dITP diphosphohydrolase
MPSTSIVLLATTNKGKLKEFQSLLIHLDAQLLTPEQQNMEMVVNESGGSYAENAALKAKAYAIQFNMVALADDSGLEVDALGSAPGIYSARYTSQPGATDADRRQFLLKQLSPFPRPWTARFHCVIAIAEPNGTVLFSDGACEGQIIPEERGQGGFGYDPIFLVNGYESTMAELSLEVKNKLSHRARAVQGAIPLLEDILKKRS